MPAVSYDGRHRGAGHSSPKRRRFMTGLALPTAAAAALTFCATGAAVVTSNKTQPVSHNATAPAASPDASAASARLHDPRTQAIEDNALDIARENAGARAARTAERKSIAARALAAKRVAARALEVKQAIAEAHSWQLPLKNATRTSDFGWRWGRLHAGEDFAASIGTNLVSMSTGTVLFAGQESGYGTMVKIGYWDGTVSYFAHMSQLSVTNGEKVEPGEIVGRSGNSGHSTGPHLHLEMHPSGGAAVDPAIWLANHKVTY